MSIEEADRTRLKRSSLVALAFWLLVAAGFALIPIVRPERDVPKYSTVRLTLNAQATAPASAAVSPGATVASAPEPVAPEPAKSATAPAASRSAKAVSRTAAAKAATKPAAPAAKSATAGGLGIPNFSTPLSGSSRDETSGETLDFQSDERPQRTDSPASANASSASEFEGVAAPIASSVPSAAKGAGTQTTGAAPAKASGETVSALGELTGAAQLGSKGGSAAGSAGTAAKGAAGGAAGTAEGATAPNAAGTSASSVSALAFDGTPRRLLQPSKIEIALPDELARLVTSNRTVVVTLTIRADGTVPSGLVEFTPSALLPARVRDWLAREFAAWRFEKGAQDGQARFSYSITVE